MSMTLRNCGEPVTVLRRVMVLETTPASVALNWLTMNPTEVDGFPALPRVLGQVFDAAYATTPRTNRFHAIRLAAKEVGALDHPTVTKFLLQRYDAEADPVQRAQIALGLFRRGGGRAAAVFLEACRSKHASRWDRQSHEGVCVLGTAEEVNRLEQCADGDANCGPSGDWLRGLAKRDWDRARKVAAKLASDHQLVRTLVRFEKRADFLRALNTIGATTPDTSMAKEVVELADVMPTGWVHAQVDTFPLFYDDILYRLARQAGGALDDVVFEEVPRISPDADEPYQLHAYMGSVRYSVTVDVDGSTVDIRALVGLLNSLLIHGASKERTVVLWTGDEGYEVLTAPPTTILGLLDAGLIQLAKL
jgi:hypothetical protein